MLFLTRRPDESIRVGDDITITVLDVDGQQISLGIHAPRDLLILRKELAQAAAASGVVTPTDNER